jgi:type VI secretion system protein ImpK
VIYGGFAWVLGEQRESVLQPYRSLDMDAGDSTFSGMK